MSNHFKGSDNNSNKNSDGSDHNRSGQSSNSGGLDHATWLKIMKGDDSQKIDVVATASTKIDTKLWEHIDNKNGPSELSNPLSDSSTRKTAEQILKDVQTKNETTAQKTNNETAAQNTTTDYTSLFMNSMRSLFTPFTPKTSEILTQPTNDSSSSSSQNENQKKHQIKKDSKSSQDNNASSSSKTYNHSRTQSNNSVKNPRRSLPATPLKKSPPSRPPSAYNKQHFRSDSTSTQYSGRQRSEYSLGGRDIQTYGVESIKSDKRRSQRTMESSVIQSTRSLWENLRHPTNTNITKEERIICEKHASNIVKDILNVENPPGLSKLQNDFKRLTADLINGKRAEVGFKKLTEGIRSEKFKALSIEEKDTIGLGALEIPEKQRNLKDMKRSLDDLRNSKSEEAQNRRKELEQEFTAEKAIFDDMTAQYNEVNDKLQSQIKAALEQDEGYQKSKRNFDQALTSVLDHMESVKEDIVSAGNGENGENSRLYIDSKAQLFKKLLVGGKLAKGQQDVTGLSTREQGLNVSLDFLPPEDSAEGKSTLIEYYVREHINFLTAYKNPDKYEFTEEHTDKLLAAMIRNAQSLEKLLSPTIMTDKTVYTTEPDQIKY